MEQKDIRTLCRTRLFQGCDEDEVQQLLYLFSAHEESFRKGSFMACILTEGLWYGGVHIKGKTGVPIALDKDEYVEVGNEPEPVEDRC